MGRCTDRRDMTKAVESGVKLQTNKLVFSSLECSGIKHALKLGLIFCSFSSMSQRPDLDTRSTFQKNAQTPNITHLND